MKIIFNYIKLPWTVSAASTTPYPFHDVHTAPCTSCRPPRATFVPIDSMHKPDHGCPLNRSQHAQHQT